MSDPIAVNPRVVVDGVDPELLHLLIEVALPALRLSRGSIHSNLDLIRLPRRLHLGRADPRDSFGIHESDGSPDEKEGRPKQQPPGYQACMMAR